MLITLVSHISRKRNTTPQLSMRSVTRPCFHPALGHVCVGQRLLGEARFECRELRSQRLFEECTATPHLSRSATLHADRPHRVVCVDFAAALQPRHVSHQPVCHSYSPHLARPHMLRQRPKSWEHNHTAPCAEPRLEPCPISLWFVPMNALAAIAASPRPSNDVNMRQ